MKQTPSFPQSLRLGLAAAALIVTGASAQAQINGVSSVDVTQNNLDYFHLAEVLTFTSFNPDGNNLSLAGVATATSSGFGSVPSDANDGNTNGDFGVGSVWHDGDANQGTIDTWTLTFSSPVSLGSVQLYGRTGCCVDRDNDITLTFRDAVGASLFSTTTGIPNDDQEIIVPVPEPSAFVLGALGTAGLAFLRRRRGA